MSETVVVRLTVPVAIYETWKAEADASGISVANHIKVTMRGAATQPKARTSGAAGYTKADDVRINRLLKTTPHAIQQWAIQQAKIESGSNTPPALMVEKYIYEAPRDELITPLPDPNDDSALARHRRNTAAMQARDAEDDDEG